MITQTGWKDSLVKKRLERHLPNEIPLYPKRQAVSLVIVREFDSTAVLTTEGQTLDVELVRSGRKNKELISRVLLQKRKQIAPERRTGRAFNRDRGLGEKCAYMEQMCGRCPDCLIYGYAATSGEGAQRSRVWTDSGFAIRSYDAMQKSITLNAIKDSTQGGVAGSAFAEREHIRPQVFFPTIETAVDVTPSEFLYILRNILATTRYGAESNRQGFVQNHVAAMLFGRGEVLSNLALTQGVYDRLLEKNGENFNEFPLERSEVTEAVLDVLNEEAHASYLPVEICTGEELQAFLASVRDLWRSEEANEEWLRELENDHQAYLEKLSK
ncbi:type I-D CRISPR-associated protein Cas7/Csc2 [Thermoactinomyces mirandus]|uniref:Type I-D CRISPR-associated protein Cas7/Csc2 n=1 Tax=Thermoactinomyces mirandus TaxID=2756294 RepID=A0A7W1XR66_9BACL|nr:type I-D CRISPR-associated protein Cas7/Csc2 [Thermoactinomyces mirandus]MBA4601739.1 type I-D CRISPR-associated protein Cas7/Csc2 [Thermoactinomyces mirandus]